MGRDMRDITRADLPATFTPETLRTLPFPVLCYVADRRNGVLDPAEYEQFKAAKHQLLESAAKRVYGGMSAADWKKLKADAEAAREGGDDSLDRNLRRMIGRIEAQVSRMDRLAPEVDWSFVPPARGGWELRGGPGGRPAAATATVEPRVHTSPDPADDDKTIAEMEDDLTEQVELVSVMQDIAEVSRRTYAMEQERALSDTRGVFFGFLVSVAVIIAGWAPVVTATWEQRWWILGLTLVTCAIAGLVYVLISRRQRKD